ncbi:ATP-binding protein [Kribbella qitaiheensis]|uniref:ATP-binding protein n=1 Tax=Kribbella qitaiheensis TaxID=1544730 RepID=A0A7G6X119_9ACTN|nr:ATP-binding protein [Kribbella qitaiheensis]QNE19934.1 ATP-binding protein [Kribbella qitaiheensis]
MSQVFGTPRQPAYMITRTDQLGRPISLDRRGPASTSVLFTGGPGMGKSLELDRAQQVAKQNGWTCVRVDASPREPLENRFVRAVSEDLGGLRKKHGFFSLRKLKKTLRDLTQRNRSQQHGAEIRLGVAPVQAVVKKQWEAPGKDGVGSTLNQLADNLGELSAKKGTPVLLMVDNLDVASERDLAALTELSAHLEQGGQQVYLIGAGGEMAATRLLAASGGMSGIGTAVTNRFDVRECGPLADDELRPSVTEPLRQAGVRYEDLAVDTLLKAANGDPGRLQDLAETSLQLAQPAYGITADVAKAATAQVNARSRVFYQAAWNSCSDAEKDLLAKVAVRGASGLSMPAETQAAGPGQWQAVDAARQGLVARGMLRDSGQRVKVADPGLQDWVQTRVGQSAAQSGVALAGTAGPALSQPAANAAESGRHGQRGSSTTRQVGTTTFTVNR